MSGRIVRWEETLPPDLAAELSAREILEAYRVADSLAGKTLAEWLRDFALFCGITAADAARVDWPAAAEDLERAAAFGPDPLDAELLPDEWLDPPEEFVDEFSELVL